MKPQVLGKGIMLNMRQHTNTHSRPVITASLLIAVILPTSLIAGGLAAADTATSEPVVAGALAPATAGSLTAVLASALEPTSRPRGRMTASSVLMAIAGLIDVC